MVGKCSPLGMALHDRLFMFLLRWLYWMVSLWTCGSLWFGTGLLSISLIQCQFLPLFHRQHYIFHRLCSIHTSDQPTRTRLIPVHSWISCDLPLTKLEANQGHLRRLPQKCHNEDLIIRFHRSTGRFVRRPRRRNVLHRILHFLQHRRSNADHRSRNIQYRRILLLLISRIYDKTVLYQ